MKRIQYDRYGGPEELRLAEVDLPEPKDGQVRIRVLASSANPMDWVIRKGQVKMMTGSNFPRGLGHDFAGVVEAIGPNVTKLVVGDEVFGATSLKEAGAFAEALNTDEKNVFIKPAELSFELAGALPIVGVTAWTGLVDKAHLRSGQSVFITGCLGGVGRAAAQLALLRGAVVAGSCSATDRAEALALGVQEVFDYRALDTRSLRKRFDVVFDTAGALSLRECELMLKSGGVALHIVNTPAKIIRSLISSRHQSIFGTATRAGMAGISDAAIKGQIVPKIGRTVSLSDAIPAIVELETKRSPKGKLMIIPAAP